MILLDTTIVTVAIPAMVGGLGASLNAIVWVVSVYLLAYAVPMLFTGRLGDRYGPRRVFLAGLFVFTLASLWCGLSGAVETLIVARAAQGLGAALLTPQTLAFVGHLFQPSERGAAMGVWAGVAGLATITGPLLGGALVEHLGWQWVFFVNVPLGSITFVLTWWLVPDWRPGRVRSFDVTGILLSAAGLFLVVFGVQNGQKYGWARVIGPISVFEVIGIGVVLLGLFVFWQHVTPREPLMPLRVFEDRNFSAGTFAWATVGFAITGMLLPLVLYLQSVLDLTPFATGLLTAPMAVVTAATGPFAGRASDKVGGKYLVLSGLVVLAGGLGLVAVQTGRVVEAAALLPALLLCGFGFGLVLAPMSSLALGGIEPTLMGTASGIFNTARQVGGVLGSAMVGVLLQARLMVASTVDATAAAALLPEHYRKLLADHVSDAVVSAGGYGVVPVRVTGFPPDLAARADVLAAQAVHRGLGEAASQSLLLPVGVLLLGAIAAAAMRRTTPAMAKTA
ncbi:DHA2 family efflux MFS transporter permease subunit [Amycolatopsis sp. lyj-23]|uniref:DHA2 family efflux MFS transporter permease subunit n=1 Tax=Amycolatopsis sp. lyj-23 TaxID=2789283 RepID=UPI00397B68ED